jgi:alpha-ketoglutarate-dependent taurine dioxygenase
VADRPNSPLTLPDLAIWDDRCIMHYEADFYDLRWKRDLQRAKVC